jgi:hypothetical protein
MSVGMYLAQSKMENEGVWGTDIELLAAASLLDTDIYVYTQVSSLYKWHKCSKSMLGGSCPKNVYIRHSNGVHYDIVLDVSAGTSDSSEDSKINYLANGDIFVPDLSFQTQTDQMQSESHKYFRPISEESQKCMCLLLSLPLVVKHKFTSEKALHLPFRVQNIIGDGNCLFRALSYAITG